MILQPVASARIIGKACAKHPELNGLRHKSSTNCIACTRERKVLRSRLKRRHNYSLIAKLKSSGKCADCGGKFHPCQMDFDHRDPSTKSFPISGGSSLNLSFATLKAEMDKCDLVCANCHRLRTWKRMPQLKMF